MPLMGCTVKPIQPKKEPVSLKVGKYKPPKIIRELGESEYKPLKEKKKWKTQNRTSKNKIKQLRKFSYYVIRITDEEERNNN